eukprot:COSAG01_NODE_1886_length_8986_cov_15.175425_7_plen_128_part_00
MQRPLYPLQVKPRPGPGITIDYSKNDEWAAGMLLYSALAGPVQVPAAVGESPAPHSPRAGGGGGSGETVRCAPPFRSGDDPRHFEDGDFQPIDLSLGGSGETPGYSRELLGLVRALLRVVSSSAASG